MILLVGLMEDAPMKMLYDELQTYRAPFYFINHRDIFNCDFEYRIDANEAYYTIVVNGSAFDLSAIRAAYVRPYNFMDYPEMEGLSFEDPKALKAARFDADLISYLDSSDVVVVNKSLPSATNDSKPLQLSFIHEVGLKVPETFISNDVTSAKQFIQTSGRVVYKSISGVRSIVQIVSDSQLAHIDDVQWCATLFQKEVPGANYRVHVIGEEIFTVRIDSDKLDYRYGNTTMTPENLPEDIAQKCRNLNSLIGLHFSGIDLMRTPDDEWYCFEVNPSPAYSYFQLNSGLQISKALAKYLINSIKP